MGYPKTQPFPQMIESVQLYAQLMHEYGAKEIVPLTQQTERFLKATLEHIKRLPINGELSKNEPNVYHEILALRPPGPRTLWKAFHKQDYLDRVEGALTARMAGCTLGALVEGWEIKKMKEWAKEIGDRFPPVDYWTKAPTPLERRYGESRCDAYTRKKMNGVPVDDDIAYTLLGLLIMEEFGPRFTTQEVAKIWVKHLPYACTAEKVALENLQKSVPPHKAGETDNPFCQWIGADIRADPWAYVAPGLPEQAAKMAYQDAYLSHRRNGIYGEMFFAAAISAAFAVHDPLDAIRIGLTEIPKACRLAKDVKWALNAGKHIEDYAEARHAVDERFEGMSAVHTNNNACLTIFGLMIGGTDVTKVLSQTVAMGLDNDCTAATAGSLVGAIVGKSGVSKHWYRKFNNTVHSYLKRGGTFAITDLVKRFADQAEQHFKNLAASPAPPD